MNIPCIRIFLMALCAVHSFGTTAWADAPLDVYVSIPPQAGVIARIAGPLVKARALVKPGQDPHAFEATPRQVMELASARLYLKIGISFEERVLEKLRGAGAKTVIVDVTEGIQRIPMEDEHCHAGHNHGEHVNDESLDPHVWLDPANLEIIAQLTAKALSEAWPEKKPTFDAGLAAFLAELRGAANEAAKLLAPVKGSKIYVYHPAFAYFCKAFGMEQRAVELGGKSPAPRQLQALIAAAKADGARVVFVQPQFNPASAKTVADAIGGAVVPMDDLAEDVVGNLRDMSRKVADSLKMADAAPR